MFGLFDVGPLKGDPALDLLLPVFVAPRSQLVFVVKFLNVSFLLVLAVDQTFLSELNQLLVLVVLHQRRQFLPREVLKRVPIKQRA